MTEAAGVITRVTLTQFRSYAGLTWQPAAGVSVLTGPNGSGKTNVLEGVSLLVPGRGLRQARLAGLQRLGSTGSWGVAAQLGTDTTLATGAVPGGPSDRRVFRLNGAAPRNQAEVAATLAAVWLVPQMDRLFQDGATARRRFLDRLVWALAPGHAREVSAYETALASRNRLLAQGAEAAWLAATEDSMARHAVAATAARVAMVTQLNGAVPSAFPAAHLTLIDPVADRLARSPALAVEDWLRDSWAGTRARDAAAGVTLPGAHRADLALTDAATGRPAAQASTGQQKALLLGVVLTHAGLITAARGRPPLLLLDEPAVHLDSGRRAALWAALVDTQAQVMLTGTDPDVFAPLRGQAQGWITGDGALVSDPWFTRAV